MDDAQARDNGEEGAAMASARLDGAALEGLYARLERPMYNVVYRWLWDAEEARDVVQEAFLRLWRARDRVRMDTVEAYLWRVALNQASRQRRWRSLRTFLGLEALGAREASLAPGAEAALMRDEASAAVRAAVDALPEKHRRVVMMCELSEMSYAQVARVLGIAQGTVASRRHTALRKLREALGQRAAAEGVR